MNSLPIPVIVAVALGLSAPAADACSPVPPPRYVIERMTSCPSLGPFERIERPVPLSWFADCTAVDGNGVTIFQRTESALVTGDSGPFVDLDLEIASISTGGPAGFVTSTVYVGVERVNDLVSWINVPVRYEYNLEARTDAIGPLSPAGRMQATVGGVIPSTSVDACALRPRQGMMHCDPSTTQVDSKSGSGLLLFGEGQIGILQAQAFGHVNSQNTSGELALGPSVNGTAVASVTLQIDPNFAFADSFRLVFSDGDCLFGGDGSGGFE